MLLVRLSNRRLGRAGRFARLGACAVLLATATAPTCTSPFFSVMTYNVLHGQPCNGGSLPSEVTPRMELAVQGGPVGQAGLAELAPDLLGMQEVSQIFRAQPIGTNPLTDNLACLIGSPPPGLSAIAPYEHAGDTLARRMNGVGGARQVEQGSATSRRPLEASPYAMRFVRDNPRVLALLPDLPLPPDEQDLSDRAAEQANLEIGLAVVSRHRIQRVTVHNLPPDEMPGGTRALLHASIATDTGKRYDFFDSHLTTGGGDTVPTQAQALDIVAVHPGQPAASGEPGLLRLRLQRDTRHGGLRRVRRRGLRRQLRGRESRRGGLHRRPRRTLERLRADRRRAHRLRVRAGRRPGPGAGGRREPRRDELLGGGVAGRVPLPVRPQRRDLDLQPVGPAMRRRVWLALLLALAALHAAPAQAACDPPRCHDVAVPLPAGVSVPENRVRILLPSGYDAQDPSTRYPVLYLLHGAGDSYATWTQNTDVEAFTAAFPLIVVMPDAGHGGSPPNEAGWYSDWQDGSRQWETFHTEVLVDYVDASYHTLGAGHRAVTGLSMGGFGAMSYAARHPGLFQAAASFSGAVDTQHAAPASGAAFANLQDAFGTPGPGVWGDQLADEPTWRAHNPRARAADLACSELFVATGTGTPGGPAGDDLGNPGGYAIESFIFQMNASFAAALVQAGVPFQQDFYTGGYHGWPYWERELHWALPQILPVIEAGGSGGPCGGAASPQPLRVMTYNLLHGQPCNGGSLGGEVVARMEFAVQGGPNREPGLAELAPDLLGMQEVSQVFREQSIGSDPTQDNLVCLAGSPPEGLTTITPYEHQADTILRRMNGVTNMRGVEDGTASSLAPTSASPYAMRFERSNPQVIPFIPDPPIGADAQTFSDFAAEFGNFESGLATLSRHPIQRLTVHNLTVGEQPGETRALTHATIRIPDPATGEGRGHDFYVSHLTTTGGDSAQTSAMATKVIQFIAANRRNPENPAFFVCDCNATPGSTVHTLFETAGFVDSFARANPGANGFTGGRDSLDRHCGQNATERIDYVWAIPDDQGRTPAVLSSHVVMDYYRQRTATLCLWPSDHNGVITTFDLRSLQGGN